MWTDTNASGSPRLQPWEGSIQESLAVHGGEDVILRDTIPREDLRRLSPNRPPPQDRD